MKKSIYTYALAHACIGVELFNDQAFGGSIDAVSFLPFTKNEKIYIFLIKQ